LETGHSSINVCNVGGSSTNIVGYGSPTVVEHDTNYWIPFATLDVNGLVPSTQLPSKWGDGIYSEILYGRLYNWDAVNTGKLAPIGWRVPTYAEWTTLSTYLGGNSVAGGKLKEIGTEHWLDPNTGATDEFGFTALPGGDRSDSGPFYNIGENGYWWSSTEVDPNVAYCEVLNFETSYLNYNYGTKVSGFSVRCIYDGVGAPADPIIYDADGNSYNWVQIGTQYWLGKNLATTKYNDGTPIPNVTDDTAWGALTTGAYCNYNNDEGFVFKTIVSGRNISTDGAKLDILTNAIKSGILQIQFAQTLDATLLNDEVILFVVPLNYRGIWGNEVHNIQYGSIYTEGTGTGDGQATLKYWDYDYEDKSLPLTISSNVVNYNNTAPGNVIGEDQIVTVKVTTVVGGLTSCKFFIKGTVTLIPIS
jgi:uncharacterized protein (TIGR02145 family)